ncbi:MAG: hypothetical protein AB7U75_22320 [Hyphomicrobiaceae bacterium]
MCEMTAEPMTDAELALYRAQRALALWESAREVDLTDKLLVAKISNYLTRARDDAQRNLDYSTRRR